jgi:carboxypeptidase Taq
MEGKHGMNQRLEQLIREFRAYMRKIAYFQHASGVLHWDARTTVPPKGVDQRSEVLGFLETEIYRLTVAPEMDRFLNELSAEADLAGFDPVIARSVREYKKENDRMKKIPAVVYEEYVVLTAKAEHVWEKAKSDADFRLFEPYLTKIVDFNRRFAELWGYQGHPYDALLDPYEPDLTVATLDQLFAELRWATVVLLKQIQSMGKPVNASFLQGRFARDRQETLGRFFLREIGFDFDAGHLAESVHPFTGGANHPGDVRLTTHYYEDNPLISIFSCIHEGGHGIYEQNIDPKLLNTPLGTGASMGIHESQSRFYENIIGRSRNFWQHYYPKVQTMFPEEFRGIGPDDFYLALNRVTPSFIRVEADELTYNLHIILRYEIEKALIGGECRVIDLPSVWNEKMLEYLGVQPRNDAEGVLQDTHWSGGDFGYFPSYSIGNIYSAQFSAAMERAGLNLDDSLAAGDFQRIKQWLSRHIHNYGKLKTPAEILKDATGETIDAGYLIRYLERKFRKVYGI